MKKVLTILFNRFRKDDFALMFGNNSKIKINSFDYSTQKKSYIVDVTLICGECDEQNIKDFYPDGLELIVNDSWDFISPDVPLILLHGVSFEENKSEGIV